MNALSLISTNVTPAFVLGTISSFATEAARNAGADTPLASAFSDAMTHLDADNDGTLSASDLMTQLRSVGHEVTDGLSRAISGDATWRERPDETTPSRTGAVAFADNILSTLAPAAQMLLAAAPALPSAPAVAALENRPGVDQIREAYATLRSAR